MREVAKRAVLLAIGAVSVVLAILGILLPVIPGVPFLILAGWAFSHSSPTIHRWMLGLPYFGPALHDWEQYGAIRLRIKVLVTVVLVGMSIYPLGWVPFPLWLKWVAAAVVLAILGFVWTRPNR